MNGKLILCFMVAYYIKLISSGQSSGSSEETNWTQMAKEMMSEELYDKNFLLSLNYVSTLNESGIELDDNDIDLLSSECKTSLRCTNKKVSTEKYHTIMNAILRVNKDFTAIILDNIRKLIRSGEKSSLDMLVKQYLSYITRIFSMLYVARVEVPRWQIKCLIQLSALISMDLKSFHFDEVLIEIFVGETYDMAVLEIFKKDKKKNTDNYDILLVIEKLYKNDNLQYAYRYAQHMTAQNVLLFHLYGNHKNFIENSKLDIDLNWRWVDLIFALISNESKSAIADHLNWGLIQHPFNRYHVLILKCIKVRVLFYVWSHVNLSKQNLSEGNSILGKSMFKNSKSETEVLQHWSSLVDPLKHIIRIFSIKDEIIWTALCKMTVDITKFQKNEISDLEINLKKEFLSMIKELDLGKATNIDDQLKTLSTMKKSDEILVKIKANSNNLKIYTSYLQEILTPINVSSIGWFLEKNKPSALAVTNPRSYKNDDDPVNPQGNTIYI